MKACPRAYACSVVTRAGSWMLQGSVACRGQLQWGAAVAGVLFVLPVLLAQAGGSECEGRRGGGKGLGGKRQRWLCISGPHIGMHRRGRCQERILQGSSGRERLAERERWYRRPSEGCTCPYRGRQRRRWRRKIFMEAQDWGR